MLKSGIRLVLMILFVALATYVAGADEDPIQKLTKEQERKIQYAEELLNSLNDTKKEDMATILEDLSSSDKIISDTIYKFVLQNEKPKIRVALYGVLKKINPEKATELEKELLVKCKNGIKPDMDYHAAGEILWEMRSLGPAAEPYFWDLFNNAQLKEVKHLILQKILELNLPETREKILRLLESGVFDPGGLITAAAKFPDTDGRAKKVILPLIKQQDNILRLTAFQALTKLNAPELYKESIAKLDDADVLVRQVAIEYLEAYIKVSPENAASAAEDIIKKIPEQYADLNELIFKSYMKLLAASHSAPAFEYLKNRLALEDNQAFKEKFLMTLTEMGTASAYEFLIDQYEQMRERSKDLAEPEKKNVSLSMQYMILKNLRHPADLRAARSDSVITKLIAVIGNPDVPDTHRLEACITLQVLTGKSTGLNPEVWTAWWTQEKAKIKFDE